MRYVKREQFCKEFCNQKSSVVHNGSAAARARRGAPYEHPHHRCTGKFTETASPRTSQPGIELEPIDTSRTLQSLSELLNDVKEELGRPSTAILQPARPTEQVESAEKARPAQEPEDEGIDFEKAFQGRVSAQSIARSASEASFRPYGSHRLLLLLRTRLLI